MRVFWSVFLMTGLVVVLVSVIERRAARPEPSPSDVIVAEDGTGFPQPYPTPKTQ